jgi:hypothetical protein
MSAGVMGGASRWVQVVPLATSAQVGTAREGVREGGEVNCCVLPPRWLNQPATPMGEAGGRRRGVEAWPTLARCDPSTPRWGEGWGWAGGSTRAILPWPPGKGGGGDGRGCGAGELELTAHHECWQGIVSLSAKSRYDVWNSH